MSKMSMYFTYLCSGSLLLLVAVQLVTLTMGYDRTWTKAGEFRVCTNIAAI